MVNWEVAIGRIRSACDRNEIPGLVSFWHYSRLHRYLSSESSDYIKDEYELEAVRREHYPDEVSRLTGVYFFESREIAASAIDRWGVNPIKKDFVTPINFSASKITRVDSEWITSNLGKNGGSNDWMHSYWQGETYGERPLTEIIASGIGIVADSQKRTESFKRVYSLSPVFARFIMFGIAGFHTDVPGMSQVIPIIEFNGSRLKAGYYMDFKGIQEKSNIDWEPRLKHVFDMGYRFADLPVLEVPNDIVVPNFGTKFDFEIEFDEHLFLLLSQFFGSQND